MIRVTIVDADESDAKKTIELLERYSQQLDVSFACKIVNNAYDFLTQCKETDLVFIDIDMPNMDGIEIAHYLRKAGNECPLVFTAKNADKAIYGYSAEASGFLIKPLRGDKFNSVMARVVPKLSSLYGYNFIVSSNYDDYLLDARKVTYLETVAHRVIIHVGSKQIEVWDSLQSYYPRLSHLGFEFCNSCYLVNLRWVKAIESQEAVLQDETRLLISKSKRKQFKERWTGFFTTS